MTAAGLWLAPWLGQPSAIAQRVVNVTPTTQNVAADSSISGQFDTSDGSTVDVDSVKIYLDDQEVTTQSTITPNFFSYRPSNALNPGTHNVRVEFQNEAGQSWRVSWSFTVERSSLEITSVTHNATEPIGTGSTFLATINGTPGAEASILLIEDGETVRQLDAQEVSPGVYVASLNVGTQDRLQEGVVVGQLERSGTTIYDAASQAVAFDPSATTGTVTQTPTSNQPEQTEVSSDPLPLDFTSHEDGGMVTSGRGFTLTGQTEPGATVIVTVTSSPPSVLGGLINVGKETQLTQQEVTADSNGQFEVQVPRPPVIQGGMRYAVEATATQDERTQTVEMSLTQE
ncbi:MAG: hypothetical protein F6K03_12790 [Kamptonema sp. SIO4C4]|nr:hypothetical protein [Kamptonema sp. SIO4C4]